ncbi:MAG: DNA replication and repair protein RecF, partial [Rhodospirillales bacterium]|nr:DNA replication and repair protein RecF [Rhodospirillales bacterium]
LAAGRAADAESGTTGVGPHRSDLVVRDVATGTAAGQCSTGQQKALLIAIILASARMQALERGSVPLLLLDEVAAHLDQRRRLALFEELLGLGAQVWMTGTETEVFRPLAGEAQFFRVADAQVAPAS